MDSKLVTSFGVQFGSMFFITTGTHDLNFSWIGVGYHEELKVLTVFRSNAILLG